MLKAYADIEISRSLYPAPCVDVLILWLAMNRKASEALKVCWLYYNTVCVCVCVCMCVWLAGWLVGCLSVRLSAWPTNIHLSSFIDRSIADLACLVTELPRIFS